MECPTSWKFQGQVELNSKALFNESSLPKDHFCEYSFVYFDVISLKATKFKVYVAAAMLCPNTVELMKPT